MKRFALFGLAALVAAGWASLTAGCGGGPPPNMATKEEIETIKREFKADVSKASSDLQKSLGEAKEKLPDILTAEKRVATALEEVKKLAEAVESTRKDTDAKVAAARSDMLKILEAEEKLLVDRLSGIRAVIQELRESLQKP